ncbi:MAG: DUF4129 domain-containing protein [Dehalococcoidales bacterium]|nr:DUF4129 domain-containing protein [Dehalococcoidales bacterium]
MKLDWRQGSLHIAIIGAEGCWLYALFITLNDLIADGILSIPWLLTLYLIAFVFNKLWRWQRRKIYVYAANGLAWAIGTLIMIKVQLYGSLGLFDRTWLLSIPQTLIPVFLLIGGSIVLWWLGWRLSRTRFNFTTSVSEFQYGVAILLLVFYVTYLAKVQLANPIPITLGFFLFALGGMALTHSIDDKGWITGPHRGLWSGLLLAGIVLILIVGLLVGSMMTPDFLQIILTPFKWLVNMISKGINFLISLIPEPESLPSPEEFIPETSPQPDEYEEWQKVIRLFRPVGRWFNTAYTVVMLGFILYVLWRFSSWLVGSLRRRLATTARAEVEQLPGAFKADLMSMLRRIMHSLRRLRWPFRRKETQALPPEIVSVRQIYRQLLRWAASSGWPRRLSQTPHEYLYTLESLLQMDHGELHLITEQYEKARYSPWLPTENDVYQLRQSWDQLRQNRLIEPDKGQTRRQEETSNG